MMTSEFPLNLAKTIQSVAALHSAARMKTPELLDQYGDSIRARLADPDHMPVLICAYNEEAALPLLFRALAASTIPLHPIVVDNHSTDHTAEVAQKLGATVLEEEQQGLVHALLHGFKYFSEQPQTFLLTDADSYPVSTWAATMLRHANKSFTPDQGGQSFAPIAYFGQWTRDCFRTAVAWTIDAYYSSRHFTRAHGPNSLVYPDNEGKLLHEVSSPVSHPPVTGTDDFIHYRLVQAGGKSARCHSPAALVLTQGDRYASIKDIFRAFVNPSYREKVYQEWYKAQPQGGRFFGRKKPSLLMYR